MLTVLSATSRAGAPQSRRRVRRRIRFHQQIKHVLLIDLAERAANDERDRRVSDFDGGGGGLCESSKRREEGRMTKKQRKKGKFRDEKRENNKKKRSEER